MDLDGEYRARVFNRQYEPLGDWVTLTTDPIFDYRVNNVLTGVKVEFATNDASGTIETNNLTTASGDNLVTVSSDNLVALSPSGVFLGESGQLANGYNVEIDYTYRKPVVHAVSDDILTDENGDPITDENGDPIYITIHGRRPSSNVFDQIRHTLFKGYVVRFRVAVDGSRIRGYLRPHSYGMAEQFLQDDDPAIIAVTSTNDGINSNRIGLDDGNIRAIAQRFSLTQTTRIDYIRVMLGHQGSGTLGVSTRMVIASSIPSVLTNINPLIETFNYTEIQSSPADYDLQFNNPIELQAGNYWFVFFVNTTKDFDIYLSLSNPYGNNARTYIGNSSTTRSRNLRLILFGRRYGLGIEYTNRRPSDMFGAVIDYAQRQGMLISRGDIADTGTGTELSYKFKNIKLTDALKKILGFCGPGYYFYCDFGTGQFHLKKYSASPDRYISDVGLSVKGDIGPSAEKIINEVVFVGGKPPGSSQNILVVVRSGNPADRRVTARLNDNRVTNVQTAKRIAQQYIDNNEAEVQSGKIEIVRNADFDLEAVRPGEVIALNGLSAHLDSSNIRISRFKYQHDSLLAEIGYPLPRVGEVVPENITQTNVIADIDTPDNPT